MRNLVLYEQKCCERMCSFIPSFTIFMITWINHMMIRMGESGLAILTDQTFIEDELIWYDT